MGPRRAVAKRRGVPSQATVERRTKQRNDQPAEPIPPRISMGNRPVTSGRKVHFNFLNQQGFSIGNWIEHQGWDYFCGLDLPIYPTLVRNFYENMRIGVNEIYSTVKGTDIVIDEAILCRILNMPNEGIANLYTHRKKEALRTVLGRTDFEGNLKAIMLPVEMRLLHSMIGRIFFPKTGRFDWVTEKDIAFIYYLSKGEKINLPYLMLNQMKEAVRKARACLPYGMVFSLLFEDFGVDCTGEDTRRLLHTDHYTDRTLHRMGIHLVDGHWIRRTSGQPRARSDSSEDEAVADVAADVDDDDDDDDDEDDDEDESDGDEQTEAGEHVSASEIPEDIAGPSTAFPTPDSPRTPSGHQTGQTTRTPPVQPARVSAEDLAQISETVVTRVGSLMGTLLEDMRQDMSQRLQTVTDSVQELRGDFRDLTLRVELLEQDQRSQSRIHDDITDLRSDFGRMRGAADAFAEEQAQTFQTIQQGIHRLESEFGSVLLRFTGTRSSFGASSTQPRPPPHSHRAPPPHPSPSTTRPPFSSTVRPGTGFPHPDSSTSRAGVASRTRSQPGPVPFRSSRVQAPFTVDLPDSDESD